MHALNLTPLKMKKRKKSSIKIKTSRFELLVKWEEQKKLKIPLLTIATIIFQLFL